MADLDVLMMMRSRGIITGKLNMAIKELLFGALEAIPETIVKAEASPIEPRHITNMNMGKSLTRLPITKL